MVVCVSIFATRGQIVPHKGFGSSVKFFAICSRLIICDHLILCYKIESRTFLQKVINIFCALKIQYGFEADVGGQEGGSPILWQGREIPW